MINRRYFYNFKWNHLDGNQSYSFAYGVVTHKSIFRDSGYVYNQAINDYINSIKKQYPNGCIEVVSFNRL